MTEHENLDLAEISAHQFTEPLKPPAKPPNFLVRGFAAAFSGRVWWRVGWTCTCVVQVLETAEEEMLLRGLIQDSLDIYQLQGTASASAGTHSKPGAYDIGQDSPEQIDVQRLCGGDGQPRTTSQGFAVKHCHGFAQGCTHGSPGLLSQKRQWNNRQNGLISHGPIQGRWPTKNWNTAVAERKKIIVGLKDELVKAISDEVIKRVGAAVWGADVIPNNFSGNAANKTVPASYALGVLGKNTKDIGKQVLGRDYIPAPDNSDPNNLTWALTSYERNTYLKVAALNAKLDTINAKLDALEGS